jgi:hypothetical protein
VAEKNEGLSTEVDDHGTLGASDGAGKGKEKDELATLRAENETLRKTNTTLSDSERFWAERAERAETERSRGTRTGEDDEDAIPREDKADYDENEESSAFVDDLSATGIKALEKRGVLTKKAAKGMIEEISEKVARKIVGSARASMTQDAELVTQFPELRDDKSALFVETKRIFARNVARDPSLKKSPAALFMAAEQAKLELKIKGGDNGGAGDGRSDEDRERQRRIKEQSGDRGRRGGAEFTEEDDDTIGPQAREVLNAMSRFGVTDDDFKKERKRARGGS